MLQARQDDLLAGLGDLAGKEDFVEDGVDLVANEAMRVSYLTFDRFTVQAILLPFSSSTQCHLILCH